jgi:hypothetical protein
MTASNEPDSESYYLATAQMSVDTLSGYQMCWDILAAVSKELGPCWECDTPVKASNEPAERYHPATPQMSLATLSRYQVSWDILAAASKELGPLS